MQQGVVQKFVALWLNPEGYPLRSTDDQAQPEESPEYLATL